MDVVGNCESVAACTRSINTILEVVLGSLDLLLCELVVVISVEIERGHNIAERGHVSLTSSCFACRVWWAHVGGVFADDVSDGHFVLDHLVDTLLVCDLVEVLVRPCVTGDLVALGVHLRDYA
jgi:hypothetical protein